MCKMDTVREYVTQIECLGETDDYVYDISMATLDPFFFGNNILVHNTDSTYMSVMPVLEKNQTLDLDSAIRLYDHVSEKVSDSFPEFMHQAFNIPTKYGKVIKAGREVVGRAGLFITKKRYAIKCLDIEGWQPEGGKMKVMGMEIKRADTPEFVQDFLMGVLDDALSGHSEEDVISKIRDFRAHLRDHKPWEIGVPKRVNNLTMYTEKYIRIHGLDHKNILTNRRPYKKEKNNMIPGHVQASIHWNMLREMNGDRYSMPITDGMKTIVCRIKPGPIGFDSVAYPIDEMNLPEWFMNLPFDYDLMEEIILRKKVKNVLGAMDWDIDAAFQSQALGDFFEFN